MTDTLETIAFKDEDRADSIIIEPKSSFEALNAGVTADVFSEMVVEMLEDFGFEKDTYKLGFPDPVGKPAKTDFLRIYVQFVNEGVVMAKLRGYFG